MLIGELAKASGTTKDTIRHYDQLGLLITTERRAGSRTYKEFSEDNLERLEMIRLAKYMGFTLVQIAQQIENYYAGGISHEEQIGILQAQLLNVQERVKQMQEVEQYLSLKIQKMTNDYDSGKLSDQQVFEILSDQLALIRGKISELQGVEQQLLNKLEVLQPKGINALT